MFTDADNAAVIELAAEKLVDRLLAKTAIEDLVALPLDAVAVMSGLGATQVRREMDTVPMGKRKLGVTLREFTAWRNRLAERKGGRK